nr:immunoglobulin light chain junction region [Macaca mulatta]MOW41072.1 immunoglobulin light chain junction region [Macaca mulatta]MOW42397.1 immunoglobulin light chain junction region [Macaca mulatta]MOW44748.1 immunoglobulin light chain junction region [Macaca mulatta]
CLQYNSDPPTF